MLIRKCTKKIFTCSYNLLDKSSNTDKFLTTYGNNSILTSGDTENHERPNEPEDKFTKSFLKNKIEASTIQKLILSAGSSIAALVDPHRHDMIACLGETTGLAALKASLKKMQESEEGSKILMKKPRINSKEINLDDLGRLPKESFGFHYKKFLDENNVTPDSRMDVKFISNPQLAYIMTRYRECHDLIHTILGMPTNMLGEVSVKWIEAINIKLPMCYGGAIFGALRLRPKQRILYVNHYLPWALECGKNAKPLLLVYWEQRWEQNIDDLRKELNITMLKLPDTKVMEKK